MNRSASPRAVQAAVLAVLTGTALDLASAQAGIEPSHLAQAVEVYQAAGYAALAAQADRPVWYQVSIEFTEWHSAEQAVLAHLYPRLRQAEADGVLGSWWFVRKAPCWRLRLRPGPAADRTALKAFVTGSLDRMVSDKTVRRWLESTYEPETFAFGGAQGMDIAHHLFYADSRELLGYLSRHDPTTPPTRRIDRRELSILLCSTLMRGAGQEWTEQGDIWGRIEEKRPLPTATPLQLLPVMKLGLRRLMTTDTGPTSGLTQPHGPLASESQWINVFDQAGRTLADTACEGRLSRGLRAVIAHHVIFHWNRMGLSPAQQSILAKAAREVVMGP